jgi:DNA-binding transcriptional ArsR family regulator
MSRGIFRRFLRYITLTLQYSESHGERIIDAEAVKAAVTVERLAEDILVELFSKQSDLRLQAVRLLMHLEESGSKRQGELAEELGVEACAMNRLLPKLELHRYITRQREGTDKIVSLWKKEQWESE